MFFDARSFAEPRLSMEHFREWAGVIANAYLKEGTEPTSSLCKIAQTEELTPDQISTLAAEANKLIHTAKHASADDKYLAADFPLADAQKAIALLQGGASTKVACVMPDPVVGDQGPDAYAMWGIERPAMEDKTASVKHQLKVAGEKTQLVGQRMSDEAIMAKHATEAAEGRFIKTARQMTLEGGSSLERMKLLGTLDHFVKQAGMPIGRKALAKLAYVLGREGLLEEKHAKSAIDYFMAKEADCKAPQELISSWLPARVVNGNHPLYITLKTFHEHNDRFADYAAKSKLVQDKLDIVRQKVRAL